MMYHMVLNDADADDLTQDVFLRVTAHLNGFRGDARFTSWLYRIAMNTARDFLARQRRSPRCCGEALAHQADCTACAPDTLAAANELAGDIAEAMGSLRPKLRGAIILTTLHDLDVSEAAQVEGCSTATMYWRIHKARKILKRRLARHLT